MFDRKALVFTGLCLASLSVMSAEQWQVSGVESWDSLNIRSQPGVTHEVIGKIPFDAANIVATGEEQSIGKTVWKKIEWDGKQGWVSRAYLTVMPEEMEMPGAEPELDASIIVPDMPSGDDAGKKPEKTAQSRGNSEIASDGMTDLEALSILARPALAETDPDEEQTVSVMPASLKIMTEE